MGFDFKNDPIDNFLNLFKEAQVRGVPEANAMTLATANEENQPSARIVYFKGISEVHNRRGLCFYTNYKGRKGSDMESNPRVGANFFWPHQDRQVRFEGKVHKLAREISEAYFATRPRLSQAGAWASAQSEKIESYQSLKNKISDVEKLYEGKHIPCPPNWGGYCLLPVEVEFWFGRAGRLHERYVYQFSDGQWDRFLRSP